MNENYEEIMEQEETMETTEDYEEYVDETETESKGGLGVAALIVGGSLALGGLAIAGVKKLRDKKAGKTKQPKTKYKWVRVPVETEDCVEEEICDKNFEEENVEN